MKTTRTVGLIPMAAKPYHFGHDSTVRLASEENDEVHLFISTGDRAKKGEFPVYGEDMAVIWHDVLEPSLPGNVKTFYVKVPVSSVYLELEEAEERGDSSVFRIYSDDEDIMKYTDAALSKSAPNLFSNGQIKKRPVERLASATKVRQLLQSKDFKGFSEMMPAAVKRNAKKMYDILQSGADRQIASPTKKVTKRRIKSENLLRLYLRVLLESKTSLT